MFENFVWICMERLLSVKLTFDPLTEQTCSGTKIPLQDTIAWFCHFGELSAIHYANRIVPESHVPRQMCMFLKTVWRWQ